jgi:hypothetical protein
MIDDETVALSIEPDGKSPHASHRARDLQQFPLFCDTSRWANAIRPYINPKFYVPHSGENRCITPRPSTG